MSLFNEPSTNFHLKANAQSFDIPHQLLLGNLQLTSKEFEVASNELKQSYKVLNDLLQCGQDQEAIDQLDRIIKRVDGLEKRLQDGSRREQELNSRIQARLRFFTELDEAKVSQDRNRLIGWYQDFTNLLVADYLTRNGSVHASSNTGVIFLKQQGLENLLDYDILLQGNEISESLMEKHDLQMLIEWMESNKKWLAKRKSELPFRTRLQEFVELLKQNSIVSAINCYQKFLVPFQKTNFEELRLASLLLVYDENLKQITLQHDSPDPEQDIWNRLFHKKPLQLKTSSMHWQTVSEELLEFWQDERWSSLNALFLREYYTMYGISTNDLLLTYLSLGISSLKTRDCIHTREFRHVENEQLNNYIHTAVLHNTCPVCTKEFAPIAQELPYAHHIQSVLFENPVMLPNGNVYDSHKLKLLANTLVDQRILTLQEDEIVDPIDKQVYSQRDFVKMYPT